MIKTLKEIRTGLSLGVCLSVRLFMVRRYDLLLTFHRCDHWRTVGADSERSVLVCGGGGVGGSVEPPPPAFFLLKISFSWEILEKFDNFYYL